MADIKSNEEEIAGHFLKLNKKNEKEKYIQNLPKDLNVVKVQEYLPGLSKKAEFAVFFYGKEKFSNEAVNEFKKQRNDTVKKLDYLKDDYKAVKNLINPLRKNGENFLRNEIIKTAYHNINKYRNFYKSIHRAEKLAEFIKEKKYNPDILDKVMSQNSKLIKSDSVMLDNLKDIFEFDKNLKNLQKNLNAFLVKYIENDKPINDVIKNAEERILTGDISNVYNEIEKTEKLISQNIPQALLSVYKSMNDMMNKNSFIEYIIENEAGSIDEKDIDKLTEKAHEYRNIILPKKWNEMKYKLKFTKKIEHYKAWYHGLRDGRYKSVVSNVKEHIVNEMLKKIVKQITSKMKNIDIKSLSLVVLLNSKKKQSNELKKSYNEFLNISGLKNSGDPLTEQLKLYMSYYFYLNVDLTREKKIVDRLFDNLKKVKSNKDKIKLLNDDKKIDIENIQEDSFKKQIQNIYDNIIRLYNLLENKNTQNNELKKIKVEDNDAAGKFLNNVIQEIESEGKVENLNEKIKKLPDEISIDVLNALSFDPRFEKYFPQIEDTLYHKDWGRTFGVINLKVKEIEKKMGMIASEEFLEDLANRVEAKLGTNSFLAVKIRNMRKNLRRIHTSGTKKLHLLQERLSKTKNSVEKILELQKISRDPRFKGVFGVIQNMERILIRDKFTEIYKKIKNLRLDTQVALFNGVKEDLQHLFEYEPQIITKVNDYIEMITFKLDNYSSNMPKVDENVVDAIDDFEKGELPLFDLTDILDIDTPDPDKYSEENLNTELDVIDHDTNSGLKELDDLEMIIQDINSDISFFKLDGSDESLELIDQANNFAKKVDDNIDKVKMLDELKVSDDVNNVVSSVISNDIEEDITDKIEKLDYIFNENNYDTKSKTEGFIIAAEKMTDNNQKTQIKEIVEVLRRIEKEVDPLYTVENKISKIVSWIENDYKDKIYIIDFLKKQIRELDLKRGREGGLLRKLLTGMEKSEDKIGYLKEKLADLEYQHLTSTIKTLIENIEKEMGIMPEEITDDWIVNSLEEKSEDEQLDWLKVRKYWDKYDKHKDVIEGEIKKRESKLKKIPEPKIYEDIIELTNTLLDIDGKAKRQSFIKEQESHLENPDNTFKKQRRLLFYLFAADSNKPDDRLKALSNRITLSANEKQELLKLLKKSHYENGSIQSLLGIEDDRLAFYSAYVLYSNKPMNVRIKYLERFKTSDDPKVAEYKATFGITDKIIRDVINFLDKSAKKNKNKIDIESTVSDNQINNIEKSENKEEINENPDVVDIPDEIAHELENEALNEVEEETSEEKLPYIKEEIHEADENDGEISKIDLSNLSDDEIMEEEEDVFEVDEEKDTISGKTTKDIIKEQQMKDDFKKKEELLKKYEQKREEEKRKNEERRRRELKEEEKNKINEEAVEESSFEKKQRNNDVDEKVVEKLEEKEKEEVKSSLSENAVKEQIIREEYDKKNEKIAKHIEELGKEKGRKIVEKIRERAHQIYEDENKKTEDKISDLLTYLTTCYPEAVSQIINDEILPVFRDEGLNLNVHNLLQSINDSIFKPAMLGKEVENNINFFSKSLTNENMENINLIVGKIQNLWKDEEQQFDKQHDSFKETLNDINTGKGIESVLVYIDTIYPEGILGELDKNFVKRLSNEKIKIKSQILYGFLKNILMSGKEDGKAKKELIKNLEIKDKFKKNLDSVIKKIKNINIANAENEKIKKDRQQFIDTKISETRTNEVKKSDINNESKNISTEKIEDVMSKVNKFVKPHIFILDLVREDDNLNEKDFDKNFRKSIINKMFNEGKIFSYDNGNTYIGRGHIYNLVKNNKIDKEDGVQFITMLNDFLKKLKSDNDIFDFIGVKNESEYRQFNFLLDKLNVSDGVGGTGSLKSNESIPKKESAKKTGGLDIFSVFTGGNKKSDDKKAPNKKNIVNKRKDNNKDNSKNIISKKPKSVHTSNINKNVQKKDDSKKYKDMMKDQKKFINKNQRELLQMASKEINKKIERLIKSANTKVDLESIYKNYFGDSDRNKKNLVNLCYDIKQVAEIISKDEQLFSRLSFNKNKYFKMYNSKMKKMK